MSNNFALYVVPCIYASDLAAKAHNDSRISLDLFGNEGNSIKYALDSQINSFVAQVYRTAILFDMNLSKAIDHVRNN